MVSNINPTINGYNQLFPVAGVNNSTQGYRNNFTSIFNNFTTAKTEIETIQNKQFLFSPNSQIQYASGITTKFIGDTTSNIDFELKLIDNIILPGTGALTVVKGNTEQRPQEVSNGYIRYNIDTNNLELGIKSTWVLLSKDIDTSTYILRSGDTVRGSLTMNSKTTDIIQLIGDSKITGIQTTNVPSFTFLDENNTGLTRSSTKELALTIDGSNRVKISKIYISQPVINPNTPAEITQHYIANFSPVDSTNTLITPSINTIDTINTKIHGQYRGYQRSHEYFIHKRQDHATPGPYPLVITTFKLGDGIDPQSCAVAFNCDFMVAGIEGDHAYVVSGFALGSFVFNSSGEFIGVEDPSDSTIKYTNPEPCVNLNILRSSNIDGISVVFKVKKTVSGVDIIAECDNYITGDVAANFEFTGKITIHFGSWNTLPIIVDQLYDY
jgi:hypothetical protein